MLKKFLIVCTCLCLIMALFNINSQLSYDTVYETLNNIGDHSLFIQESFSKVGLMIDVVPDYFGVSNDRTMYLVKDVKLDDDGDPIYILHYLNIQRLPDGDILNEKYDEYKCAVKKDDDGKTFTYSIVSNRDCPSVDTNIVIEYKEYVFQTEELRDEVYDLVSPFVNAPHRTDNGFGIFDAVVDSVNAILYLFAICFALIEMVLHLAFGLLVICWDLISAALKIIGLI